MPEMLAFIEIKFLDILDILLVALFSMLVIRIVLLRY